MKKKITSAVSLCLAALLLAGCGGNNGGNNSGGSAKPSDSEHTLEAKGSEYAEGIYLKPLKDPTVVYMTNTTWEFICEENKEKSPTPIYHAMSIWKETYGKEVTIDLVDWDSYTDHLITATASGSAPDVMRYYENTNHPTWAVRNLISPIDTYLSLDDEDYNLDYSRRYAVGDKIYALFGKTMNMPMLSIVYNKTKIEQSGQKTPIEYAKAGQWNWTNFVKLCKAMTNTSKNDYGLTGWNYGVNMAVSLAYLSKDGKVVNNIDNTEYRSMYSKLYDILVTDPVARRDTTRMDARTTLPNGQDTMAYIESLEYPQFVERAAANGGIYEMGLAPVPTLDFLNDTQPRGCATACYPGFAISSAPQNSEAAAEFVRLVTQVASNISRKSGKFGTVTDYLTDEEKEVYSNLKVDNKEDYVPINTALAGSTKYQSTIWGSGQITKTASQLIEADKAALAASIQEFENSIS